MNFTKISIEDVEVLRRLLKMMTDKVEEDGWTSIDNTLELLDEVVSKLARVVDVDDIERYISPMMATIYRHAREGSHV